MGKAGALNVRKVALRHEPLVTERQRANEPSASGRQCVNSALSQTSAKIIKPLREWRGAHSLRRTQHRSKSARSRWPAHRLVNVVKNLLRPNSSEHRCFASGRKVHAFEPDPRAGRNRLLSL